MIAFSKMQSKIVVPFLLGLLIVTGQNVAENLNNERWDFLDLLSRNTKFSNTKNTF